MRTPIGIPKSKDTILQTVKNANNEKRKVNRNAFNVQDQGMGRQFVKKRLCENLHVEHANFTHVDDMTGMKCEVLSGTKRRACNYTVSLMLTS